MSEKLGRKRLIGLGLTGCACIGIAAAGTLLGGSGQAAVLDCEVNEIGTLFLKNGSLVYECEDGCESYLDIVRNEVTDIVMAEEGTDEQGAAEKVVSDKMEIKTAFSQDALEAIEEAYTANTDPAVGNSASVVCDAKGRMLACVSVSAGGENYNYVTVPAYAGSAIKPLSVYAPALEDGTVFWASMYRDSPYAMVEDETGQMVEWPVNTEPYTGQMLPVEDAVSTSNNAIAVKVLKDYGAQKSALFLRDSFGINTDHEMKIIQEKGDDRALSNLALGYLEQGMTVQQMAGAYQIFANGGTYSEPHTVTEILSDEEIYYTADEEGEQIVSAQTAYITNRLLRCVVLDGTGTAAQIEGVDVCGKTGTSEYGDHWFAGIIPGYTCAVWYEEAYEGGATERSVRIFRDIMEKLGTGEQTEYLEPDGMRESAYCKKSGLLAGSECEDTGTGYFEEGNMPGECNECGQAGQRV